MRQALEWVLVKVFEVFASIVIPDPTDGVWDEYEREGR